MNLLITGGAGYIGSVLTPTLLAAGHHVTVIDNLLFGQTTLLDCCHYETFTVVNGDARDERLMRELAPNADVVIPLAALVGAPLCDVDAIGATTTNPDAVRMLCGVNDFVYRAVRDRFVVVFEGHFKRNYIHIRDVARAFLHVLDRFAEMQGRPYNVGLDEANLSKLELCAEIKKQVPEFVYLEAAIGKDPDKRDYIVSNARIKATGFEPQWTLAAGISELIKGCRLMPPAPGRNR